jgi:hypothetical protein
MWVSSPLIVTEDRACPVIIPDQSCPGAARGPAPQRAGVLTGWGVAVQDYQAQPGAGDVCARYVHPGAFAAEALDSLRAAMDDGVDVRGYLHWSLLDNYEWISDRCSILVLVPALSIRKYCFQQYCSGMRPLGVSAWVCGPSVGQAGIHGRIWPTAGPKPSTNGPRTARTGTQKPVSPGVTPALNCENRVAGVGFEPT